MVNDRLPPDAGIPDIKTLLCLPPGVALRSSDFACLLRCYLREANRVTFMILCGAGYLTDTIARALPQGLVLREVPLGVGLPFTVTSTGNGHVPTHFVIAQLVGSVTLMVIEYAPDQTTATTRTLSEEEYFRFMKTLGVEPAYALRLVHDTIWTAANAGEGERVEPLATRLKGIGKQIGRELQAHDLPW